MPWDIARCMLMVVHHNAGICMSGVVSHLCTVHGCTIAGGHAGSEGDCVGDVCGCVSARGVCRWGKSVGPDLQSSWVFVIVGPVIRCTPCSHCRPCVVICWPHIVVPVMSFVIIPVLSFIVPALSCSPMLLYSPHVVVSSPPCHLSVMSPLQSCSCISHFFLVLRNFPSP